LNKDGFKNLIVVLDGSDILKAFELYDKIISDGNKALILVEDNINISNPRYSVKKFRDYQSVFQTDYFILHKEALSLLCSLGEAKVEDNLSFRQLTMYEGIPLWDLSFQYASLDIESILHNFNMIESILGFEAPSKVCICEGKNNLTGLFKLICQKKQIEFLAYKKQKKRSFSYKKVFCKFKRFIKKTNNLLSGFCLSISNFIKSKYLSKNPEVLFFVSVRRTIDTLIPVIHKYKNKDRVVVNIFLSDSGERLKKEGIAYLDFYGYKLQVLFNKKQNRILKNIKSFINKDRLFYNELRYREVNIGPLLGNMINKVIDKAFPANMKNIDISRKIISFYKPKVIVVTNYSPDIILTARNMAVPVICSQNGFIKEAYYCGGIITDAVTVDGEYWKKYLLEENPVDPHRVIVTGPVKFDAMKGAFLDKKNDRLSRFDKAKKTVVFAASGRIDIDMKMLRYEKISQLKSVCRAMTDIKGARLIIKLHPHENDIGFYEKIIETSNLTDVILMKDIEIYDLLYDCDLVIMHVSTTGYEAVLMDKNVISLSGTSNMFPHDIWDFKRYNAAIIINDFNELEGSIRKALFDNETIDMLKRGRKEYIKEHAYKLDGKASERVKAVIDGFILK
jgi:hypothetical protein